MMSEFKHIVQNKITRLFVSVFLGFIVLTASANFFVNAKKIINLQNGTHGILKNEHSLITTHSEERNSKETLSISPGGSVSWNSTSAVLP